ncbi:MAG: hypothetical protein B6226_02325 [Candidatus Cloacimonetes bacterium 4572_65]|nr:MAG: hypothetical protein B6226_02325 [Candidatus Cloacimonetes bacterium 4572_65]
MYSYDKLEFIKIKELMKEYADTIIGEQKIESLSPLKSLGEINKRADIIASFQSLLKEGFSVNLEGLSDLKPFFEDFKSLVMSREEFAFIVDNVRIGNVLLEKIGQFEGFKDLKKIFKGLRAFPNITSRFDQIFDSEGDVKDSASPELSRIRKKRRTTRSNINKTLNTKLNDPKFEKFVQEKLITTRGGRYVVPIKEGKVHFVGGVVQERSTSGSSIYVEPPEVVEMNNNISMLKQAEKEEIYKIFRAFTEMILPLESELTRNTGLIGRFDFYLSCAAFSNFLGANKVTVVNEGILSLKEARHPLLIQTLGSVEKVIPYNLEMGEDYNLLILSGPNTGGKTVTLKSTGLLTIMAMTGLPVPADKESKIGRFTHIFADIGDEQSLETSLSTFSSHITNIKKMVENADDRTLILIDEIGSSTDPEQGSALAQAILEDLEKVGAKGIITTHFTALKVFAEKNKNCRNASMQFDSQAHKPTYKFVFGLPGDSFAIDVADGLGLGKGIVERARVLAGTQNVELTNLIKRLEEEKKKLGVLSYKHDLQIALLKGKEKEYQKKIDALESEAKEIKKQQLKDAQQYLIDLQRELNHDLSAIKRSDRKDRKVLNQKTLKKLNDKHGEINRAQKKLTPVAGTTISEPVEGMKVWVLSFETEAVIIDVDKKKITVDMNGITFKTNLPNLVHLDQKGEKPKKEITPLVSQSVTPSSNFELKLLGLTFDESRVLINDFIDNAYLGGLKKLRIVHGKGTGALRQKVRLHLKRIKEVKTFYTPPENAGGSGVTIVELKE